MRAISLRILKFVPNRFEIGLRKDDIISHACLEYIAQLLRAFACRIK